MGFSCLISLTREYIIIGLSNSVNNQSVWHGLITDTKGQAFFAPVMMEDTPRLIHELIQKPLTHAGYTA